jgi:eukaryotic-like serine/threonine-protein kinase
LDNAKSTSKAASAVRSATRSVFHSVAVTSLLLRKQLWIWPVIAAVVLGACGWWVSRSVENAMRERRIDELNTILNADVAALRIWMVEQGVDASFIAKDDGILPAVESLLKTASDSSNLERALTQSKAQDELRARLKPQIEMCHYQGFFLVSPDAVVLAADQDAPIGKTLSGYRGDFFKAVLNGGAGVSKTFRSPLLLKDKNGELKTNLPTMFAAASAVDKAGKPVAVLGLRIRPEDSFTKILQTAQNGATGETYAFDHDGLFLSESRFDDDLKQIGLLSDTSDAHSILTLELRDPGVDMTTGARPVERRANQPLTRMAASAVQGEDGVDVTGYGDYRGVPVIGAWTWLKDYGFGVATEQDVAEAFRPLYVLREAFWGMFALLVVAAVAIFIFTVVVARANRAARLAALEAMQLGQYTLDEKLGEGGMGVVYRAHHAMLQRPTAVKFLGSEKTNDQTIARFEREVQLTAKLNHPNTIAIYDYGRTPEGIFYYAMEYLQGINLEDLVKRYGPQPEGRVISILRQVCGSLAEAHQIGLIHRDIKPANIILTERGGIYDFAKLLDFGLAKALDSRKDSSLTAAGSLTGTPLYLSPEAVQNDEVDGRSDLYALGAVGYFMLTGSPVFDGTNVLVILQKHVEEMPESPSQRLGRPICVQLENLLIRCLAKDPRQRPQSAVELSDELAKCTAAATWSEKDAQQWWKTRFHGIGQPTTKPETERASLAATQMLSDEKLQSSNLKL